MLEAPASAPVAVVMGAEEDGDGEQDGVLLHHCLKPGGGAFMQRVDGGAGIAQVGDAGGFECDCNARDDQVLCERRGCDSGEVQEPDKWAHQD